MFFKFLKEKYSVIKNINKLKMQYLKHQPLFCEYFIYVKILLLNKAFKTAIICNYKVMCFIIYQLCNSYFDL